MRIGFFGTPDVAATALDRLVADRRFEVAVVVTNPDRPSGRGRRTAPPPVKAVAAEHGIDVLQPDRPAEVADAIARTNLDVCAVVAYGAILPPELLSVPRLGFVNLHFSLLPRWRGAAPVQHALRAGDRSTGVTVFVLDEGMDTGPVLRQRAVDIEPDEDAGSLLGRLAEIGADVLADALVDLGDGITPTPQSEQGVTYAPKIAPADLAIDWRNPAEQIEQLVRSASPRPGAASVFRGQRVKILRARRRTPTEDVRIDATPGEVVDRSRDRLTVACGGGSLIDLEVLQIEGRSSTPASSFVNGYDPQPGERFGQET